MTMITKPDKGTAPGDRGYYHHRGYKRSSDRKRALTLLAKLRPVLNYFVCYRDTKAEYALAIGHADWVPSGGVYVNR
jgi:hypothetical protein